MRKKIILVFVLLFVISGIWTVSAGIKESLQDLVWDVVQWLAKAVSTGMAIVLGALKGMIEANPDPYDVKPMTDGFIKILVPIYTIAIVVTGIYLIFVSVSPGGRMKAKSMISKLILSMILVSISTEIYSILLTISSALTKQILAGVFLGPSSPFMMIFIVYFISPIKSFVFFLPTIIFSAAALFVVGFRYMLVLMMAVFFPFTLFLYFFDLTQGIGRRLMRYTMMAIFTQPVQAFMVAIMVLGVNGVNTTEGVWGKLIALCMALGGLAMIAIAPLMMMGLMKWIGAVVAAAGMVVSFVNPALGAAMTAAGGIASGMGAGGLIAGGMQYGLGSTYVKAQQQQQNRIQGSQRPQFSPRERNQGDFAGFFDRMDNESGGGAARQQPSPQPSPQQQTRTQQQTQQTSSQTSSQQTSSQQPLSQQQTQQKTPDNKPYSTGAATQTGPRQPNKDTTTEKGPESKQSTKSSSQKEEQGNAAKQQPGSEVNKSGEELSPRDKAERYAEEAKKHGKAGEYEKAANSSISSGESYQRAGDDRNVAMSSENTAGYYDKAGKPGTAAVWSDDAAEGYEKIGDTKAAKMARKNAGEMRKKAYPDTDKPGSSDKDSGT